MRGQPWREATAGGPRVVRVGVPEHKSRKDGPPRSWRGPRMRQTGCGGEDGSLNGTKVRLRCVHLLPQVPAVTGGWKLRGPSLLLHSELPRGDQGANTAG